jgi:putative membrane protein
MELEQTMIKMEEKKETAENYYDPVQGAGTAAGSVRFLSPEEPHDGNAKSCVNKQDDTSDDSASPNKDKEEQAEDEDTQNRYLQSDSVGRDRDKRNWFTSLVQVLKQQRYFFLLSIAVVVAWSCVCAWYADYLADEAEKHPGGRAERWLTWLEGGGSKFRMVGILFVFAVVFRFNRCYDRWNQGRIVWGRLVSVSLDLTRMVSYWMVDPSFGDTFNRWVVVFAFACKALVRGHSLGEPEEEGQALVTRGYLTKAELQDMEENSLGWQAQYCLDMMGTILVEAHYSNDTMMFDSNHKVHSQLFRAVDGNISQLGHALGDMVRIRASGLPETYDDLHHAIFYFYFILAPVFYAATVGWVLPFMIGLESLLIMSFVTLGSDLVQPFGEDNVDLPLEFFCETIENQTDHIRDRAREGTIKRLARLAIHPPATKSKSSGTDGTTAAPMGRHKRVASMGRSIKTDAKQSNNGKTTVNIGGPIKALETVNNLTLRVPKKTTA